MLINNNSYNLVDASSQGGFAALASVLVIGAIVTLIGITVALTSVNEGQMSLVGVKGTNALSLVKGCSEVALLELNTNNSLPATVTIPAGTCAVVMNSQVGETWDFTVSGSFSNQTKSTNLIATRSSTVSVYKWQEMP